MRKRLMLVVAPLCVVAVAASVAFASPSDAEHSGDAKLDNLHAERRDAALTYLDPSVQGALEVARLTADVNEYVQQVTLQQYLDAIALTDFLAGLPSAPVRASAGSSSYSGNGDFLACVKNRESGGDYGVYNSGGSGAAGAYQFMPGTWNSIAGSVGRSDLVGVDPAQASPADQDAMAAALYAQQGSAPWGGYCG
ncbi:MAG: transglycosylase family protein [Acidimicrobiia bacterium]